MYVPVTANFLKEFEMLSKFSTFFIYPQHSLSDCDANQLFFARKVLRQKQDLQTFKRGSKSKFVLYHTLLVLPGCEKGPVYIFLFEV